MNDGNLNFYGEQVTNEAVAHIVADDGTIAFKGGGVTNEFSATIEAKNGGAIAFDSIPGNPIGVYNETGGKIEAKNPARSLSKTQASSTTPAPPSRPRDYGTVTFIETPDSMAGIENAGMIEATDQGTVAFDNVGVGESGGVFYDGGAKGRGHRSGFARHIQQHYRHWHRRHSSKRFTAGLSKH